MQEAFQIGLVKTLALLVYLQQLREYHINDFVWVAILCLLH